MPSPPKPWETAGASGASAAGPAAPVPGATAPPLPSATPAPSAAAAAPPGLPPAVPDRPDTLLGSSSAFGASPYASPTPYGSSPYGTTGSYNRFGSSPYSSYGSGYGSGYGGYGSTYGTGYGGYGSGYGGYGSSYGTGYGGYGGGYGMRGGPGMGPNGAQPSELQTSTQAAFDLLNSLVQGFGSFATMLDMTLNATFSSFHAMMAVGDQFGALKATLGQVFSVFGLLTRLRKWIVRKVTGREPDPPSDAPPAVPDGVGAAASADLAAAIAAETTQPTTTHFFRNRPYLVAVIFAVGVPYLIHRWLQRMRRPRRARPVAAHALYDYNASTPAELSLRCGDTVTVLEQPIDPASGAPGAWWRGRRADGQVGYFPANYVEVAGKPVPVPVGPSGDMSLEMAVWNAAPTAAATTTTAPAPVQEREHMFPGADAFEAAMGASGSSSKDPFGSSF
ncbi:hypothetical protein AMAG_03275 [Allomyces macrogynus ATCC 38327]|uniref:Peroxisomal membrane protein PEX13 n=1 Tax=Allomyces macrogynus (strain ATCC 38327) TaxID=578462 RepID=A0A0L0S4X6_ALLM3|nr:hypothetical protein AMAG_03275 [Allomyces macrogynus ATCC 38327]|eukprot:KNE57583.1 hypothetical protein AMAG_03275 [Allomyces macrogynus ATCC 38327]